MGVCYGTPDQEEQVDQILYRQIGVGSSLQALVFMGVFNHHLVETKHNRTKGAQGSIQGSPPPNSSAVQPNELGKPTRGLCG